MSDKKSSRFLKPEAVLADHGGEIAFWARWLAGELPAVVKDWAVARAVVDASFKRWLGVVENPLAHKARAIALELSNYLVGRSPSSRRWGRDVKGQGSGARRRGARSPRTAPAMSVRATRRGRSPYPPEARVQEEATELLNVLVGKSAVRDFNNFEIWLGKMRHRMKTQTTRLDRLLTCLLPEFVEEDAGQPRYRLSFRLFMRDRFYRHAVEKGWKPLGQQFDSLPEAFHALTRERLGELARSALVECEASSLRRGWHMACLDGAA